jgi:hypothetical protein
MKVSVLVPYRPDGGHRDSAWAWIERRWWYSFHGDEIELLVGGDDGGRNPGEFNHPLAINRLADEASGDVFVIADADTAPDPWFIRLAASWVQDEIVNWALPMQYRKLTQQVTEGVIATNAPDADLNQYETEWIGESVSWSGTVVAPRAGFELVGGYDERFAFWGADDSSFAAAMSTLWGPVTRLPGACFHFWHPAPLEETYGHARHQEQHALNQRYLDAWGDVEAMRKVRFTT